MAKIPTTGAMRSRKADAADAEKWRRLDVALKSWARMSNELAEAFADLAVAIAIAVTVGRGATKGTIKRSNGATSRRKGRAKA